MGRGGLGANLYVNNISITVVRFERSRGSICILVAVTMPRDLVGMDCSGLDIWHMLLTLRRAL